MATVNVNLTDEQLAKLKEYAVKFQVSPEDLLRATVEDMLARPGDDFLKAAEHVLKKNSTLYERLAR